MKHDVMSDTWVATDALGRRLPGYEECGPPRSDKFVGIFYFIARNYGGPDAPRDVTRLLRENPDNPQFWPGVPHHWGEPEFGYYQSSERWVIRKHAYMLADAGVDTLIFDVTNDQTFPDTYEAVLDTFRQIRGEGEKTPGVCFLASERSAFQLWENLYSRGRYADLWFMWKGKPLLLFGQHGELRGDMNDVVFPQHITDFFTIRRSWAWDSLSWYGEEGYHRWPWVDHTPQCVGWDVEGVAEHVPVAIGEHPLSNIGRSYHDGKQPETDKYDETPLTDHGPYFNEQWARALKIDPEFIFVTGWNEWSAGGQICTDPSYEALQAKWSFFPGAQLGRAGKPLQVGDVYFIDQYNREYSRDAEPMRGFHTDNYYYQLIDGVRRYKGVRPLPIASEPKTIAIDGSFHQWNDVLPEYKDHLYDTRHRINEPGWGSAGPYTNTTGRNEFVCLKVARDATYITFYAQTRGPISPSSDPNWMLLFINTDQDKTTGWKGYNILINDMVVHDHLTTVKASTGGYHWSSVGEIHYRVEGNQLMLAVPRALLGLEQDPLRFDFHWADNIRGTGDLSDFFDNGDSAPPRRFDYRYLG
ncbi:MAG: hypothetical protein P1S60_06070 [Anaerolineae bacterium]|nr:hypothetical protein [Anaerolineae bacterium]